MAPGRQRRCWSSLDSGGGFMLESVPMKRRFSFPFFYFPCLLAEGTG